MHNYHNTSWHHNGWFGHGGHGWYGNASYYPGWRNNYYWGAPRTRWYGNGIGTWNVDYTSPNPGLTYNWPPQYYLYGDPVDQATSPWPPGYQLNGGTALKQYLATSKNAAKPVQH